MDKVLIVDGNADFVASLKDGLDKMHQFEVLTASDGEEDLERVQRERPDLVVLDVMMPVMNGRQTLAELRRMDPEARVLIMSGYRDETTLAELREAVMRFIQ